MRRLPLLPTIMLALLLLHLLPTQTASATTVDLDKWSGSITLANGGKASWLEDLGGVTNPSFETALSATPGTGVWHRRFFYAPDHVNVSDPVDLNVLYYDRSTDRAYHGSYSFKFDFRWYASTDITFPSSPDGYVWYYAQLWNTTSPLDSASGNVKIIMYHWLSIYTYNWHTSGATVLVYDTYIWINITYLDTSGVQRTSFTEVVCHDANYTSTSWELAEATLTDCRRIQNITIELRLRLLSTTDWQYTILAGSEIRLTWYLDMIVITEPQSVSQSPTAAFTATPNGNTTWSLSLDYPTTGETLQYLQPKLTAYVPKHWVLSLCEAPTGADVTSSCARSSFNSTHDAVEIPASVISSYGAGTYTLTFIQKPVATGVVLRDQYGEISIADVGETVTFNTTVQDKGLSNETIIAYQDGTVYKDVPNTLPVSITMPSEPAILVCMIRVWNSTHRTLVRRYFTCDRIMLDLTFTRLNATAVNMTVVTKSKLNGTVLTGTTVVVNKTKKPTTNGRLSEIYTLGAKGIIPVYAFHNAYLMNASDEYSFAWDGNASAWGDANITYFAWDTQYLYEYLETEDLPPGTEVAIHFWRGDYDVDSVQVITGTLVGYTLNSEVIVRARAASPISIKVVLKTAGVTAPGGGGAVTGGAPPPPEEEEEVAPPPTPPYVEVRPEWIVAFIIGSLLIYAIFRVSRRYTATFTNYTCPYCGERLEYAYLRRLGRTYLYCPRCRRFFVPTR